MPDARVLNKKYDEFKWAMVCKLVTIQSRLDLWNGTGTSKFMMEGMLAVE